MAGSGPTGTGRAGPAPPAQLFWGGPRPFLFGKPCGRPRYWSPEVRKPVPRTRLGRGCGSWAGPGRAGQDRPLFVPWELAWSTPRRSFISVLSSQGCSPVAVGPRSPSPAGMFWEPGHSLAMACVVSRRGDVQRSPPEQALAWRALSVRSQALLLSFPGTPALFEHCCRCSCRACSLFNS